MTPSLTSRVVNQVLAIKPLWNCMDMNPASEVYKTMPPLIKTLLKSTEPYLDEYFTLNFESIFQEVGFEYLTPVCHSSRHRTLMARVVS